MKRSGSELTPRGRQWLATIQEWERSGLSMREFCARRGLSAATLSWWRQELAGRGEGHRGERVQLVEISAAGGTTGNSFAIELRNGLRLQVPTRFDAGALKELLGVLGSC